MLQGARLLERPLPKPDRDVLGYASARILEALLEALLALEFLEQGYTRNAAGKAFVAWKALVAGLLALERDRLLQMLRSTEERGWLREKGIPRVPSTRLKPLSLLLEEAGYQDFHGYTAVALDLHDYQYHGPDPDLALSRYRSRVEAARDIVYLLKRLARIVDAVAPRLQEAGKWTGEHGEALEKLKGKLGELGGAGESRHTPR